MELNKSFFRITPEAFKSINVHFTRGKHLTMINPQMSITAKHIGTSRLRKGGDLAATDDDIESGIETSDIVSPDFQLFLT